MEAVPTKKQYGSRALSGLAIAGSVLGSKVSISFITISLFDA